MHALIVHCHPEPVSFNTTLTGGDQDYPCDSGVFPSKFPTCIVKISILANVRITTGIAKIAAFSRPWVSSDMLFKTTRCLKMSREKSPGWNVQTWWVFQFPIWWHSPRPC